MANELTLVRTQSSKALASRIVQALPQHEWRTRFAPAPTGYLHLGHVVNALYVWGIARAYGGTVQLRIEDHDATRARSEFEGALLDDLEWLGLHPNAAAINEFRAGASHVRQSDNMARYEAVLRDWEERNVSYRCVCTRTDIARVVGNATGEESRYPGTCAQAHITSAQTRALRARMADIAEVFDDIALGEQTQNPCAQCGDVLVRDRNGQFTYQFAVAIDDFDQHIDVIIRGADLLSSTARQYQLARMLGRTVMPLVLHHPLILRNDGIKLSKSLGDTGVRELRKAGAAASEVLGQAAHAAGLITRAVPMDVQEIALLFLP